MKEEEGANPGLPSRVLYVEDNPVDADLVRRALARQAPQVALEVAPTLADAKQRLDSAVPGYELLLSDLSLPDGNGMELLAHVRERSLPVAVVILTGAGDQDSAIAALKAGADDYVVKRADYRNRLIPTLAAALARFRTEAAGRARPLRVLYAEHNAFDIDLTRRHFARHAPQIRLQFVEGGQELLDALPRTMADALPYDVVLLDYQLPGMDALETAKILRYERGLDLPVVLVTGRGSEDVVAEALRLGVSDYVVKHAGYLNQLPAILEHAHRQAQLVAERRKAEAELQRFNAELEQQVRRRTADLERANEALLHSNEELQRFAYIASHDLQTPLRAIVGFAQILQKDYRGRLDGRADELIGYVVEAGRHMQTLIQDLLAYSRVDFQARPFMPVDLNLVLKSVLDSLQESIREAGAQVAHGDLPTVRGDPLQLTQLLQNLVENGIKYHGSDVPQVEIRGERQGKEWVISVRDNGIGIDARHHEAVFEIFRRLHTQHAYPGTGIGLAICRRVVERHGGRIWVESLPGKGSIFRFSLPDYGDAPRPEGDAGMPTASGTSD
jgi:signal transduction histidine kinase